MVMTSTPYYHNLDRGYYNPGEGRDEPLGVEVGAMPTIYPESDKPYIEDSGGAGLTIKDIGQGVPLGIAANNIQGVDAKLRTGIGHIEIQFPGAVRSNRQAQTPGVYGYEQRVALKELQKAREVSMTTHASFGIMGLAGQDQQGNYSKEQRKTAVDEVKRAIEFAADATAGGSVVVHTGEFQRPLSMESVYGEEDWRWQHDKKGKVKLDSLGNKIPEFRAYDEESDRAVIRVIDDRTGQVMQQVRKNQRVAIASWRQYNNNTKSQYDKELQGQKVLKYSVPDDHNFIKKIENKYGKDNPFFYTNTDGEIVAKTKTVEEGDYLDYENNIVIDPLDVEHGRVPEYNKETGRFESEMRDWNYFENDADEWNRLEQKRMG